MSGAHGDHFSFRVPVDRASYLLPTTGVAMLGATGMAVVVLAIGPVVEGLDTQLAGSASGPTDALAMGLVAAAAVASAGWWIRRRSRIHRERRVVIDAGGVTLEAFATRGRTIPWPHITRVIEAPSYGEWDRRQIEILVDGRPQLRIDEDHFQSYDLLRFVLLARLPERTTLLDESRPPADVQRKAREVMAHWPRAGLDAPER